MIKEKRPEWCNVTRALTGARKKAGLSMRSLAKEMGISAAFLSEIETGAAGLPFSRIASLPAEIRGPVIDAAQADLRERAAELETLR